MIAKEDVVIAISYSGESAELNLITPTLKRQNVLIVAITGNKKSTLAKLADVTLHCSISKEACPLGLAPTSSTTATLALGDALAIALLRAKGFTEHDFAKSHPGGSLGRSLLTRVSDIMRSGDEFPQVTSQTGIQDAIIEITSKKMGITAVMENNGLVGIITDGDLRRAFQKSRSLDNLVAKEIMTASPKTITDQALAAEAVQLMEKYNINQLIVLDREKHPTGVVGMHDLLRAKIL
jgi:arabinose-5-phosphate isomerase